MKAEGQPAATVTLTREVYSELQDIIRRQAEAIDLRPQLLQPEREPSTLETGMAGEQHAPALPRLVLSCCHDRHGPFPAAAGGW